MNDYTRPTTEHIPAPPLITDAGVKVWRIEESDGWAIVRTVDPPFDHLVVRADSLRADTGRDMNEDAIGDLIHQLGDALDAVLAAWGTPDVHWDQVIHRVNQQLDQANAALAAYEEWKRRP